MAGPLNWSAWHTGPQGWQDHDPPGGSHHRHQRGKLSGQDLTLELALPAARPGQFAMVWLPNVNERPLSLLDADPVRFTVARVGAFTAALHDLRLGDRLWVRGPLGQGFTVRGRHLLLVGGGYGVAPLHFLARAALAAGAQVSVVIGAYRRGSALYGSLRCPGCAGHHHHR
ncbi:hypothetical protein [Candidatus Amarolinea dominans]|uniref:hypothetical protein n=1 Tax=Candidatus Amarolinea dominans TaxID=3140696 RepID=UPI0031370C5D|nr:hypothetical protein [Anaerolineae bacterium]